MEISQNGVRGSLERFGVSIFLAGVLLFGILTLAYRTYYSAPLTRVAYEDVCLLPEVTAKTQTAPTSLFVSCAGFLE